MIEQDVREAAANAYWQITPANIASSGLRQAMLEGRLDDAILIQAFARMKKAGRREGLRQAAEVLQKRADGHFADEHTDAMFACDEARKAITALMGDEK